MADDGLRVWAAAGHLRAGVLQSLQALNSPPVQPQRTLDTTLWSTCVCIPLWIILRVFSFTKKTHCIILMGL